MPDFVLGAVFYISPVRAELSTLLAHTEQEGHWKASHLSEVTQLASTGAEIQGCQLTPELPSMTVKWPCG